MNVSVRHLFVAGAACMLAACAPNRAPVVERPVQDARPDPVRARKAPAPSVASGPKPTKPVSAPPPPAAKPAEQDDWRPDHYRVRQGDTLYAIALDHGEDYRDLAAWNALQDPNVIRIGQLLRVKAPAGWTEREEVDVRPMQTSTPIQAAPLEPVAPPPLLNAPKAVRVPYSERALAELRGVPYLPPATARTSPPAARPAPLSKPASSPAATSTPARTADAAVSTPAKPVASTPVVLPAAAPAAGTWAWPVRGQLLQQFNTGANPKGIAIAAQAGAPVLASAPGKVVYSGSGLRGYGKLVIVKHDRNYLSVYAHNRELLVKEGERVDKGQQIAEVGNSGSDRVALHFEIRKLGRPVDPLQYLAPL